MAEYTPGLVDSLQISPRKPHRKSQCSYLEGVLYVVSGWSLSITNPLYSFSLKGLSRAKESPSVRSSLGRPPLLRHGTNIPIPHSSQWIILALPGSHAVQQQTQQNLKEGEVGRQHPWMPSRHMYLRTSHFRKLGK